jgi:hypothetical protein
MNKILNLIGRTKELFCEDINNNEKELSRVSISTFLVISGNQSIGQALKEKDVIKEFLL